MFKRKNKGKKTKEKKSTSTNKNWWKTGDWQGKIEEGRLHIYTWLMVRDDNADYTKSTACWVLLKKCAKKLTGLEYSTSSKWTKVDGDTTRLPIQSGDSTDKGWHLRQLKIRAVTSAEGWRTLDQALKKKEDMRLTKENSKLMKDTAWDRHAKKQLNKKTKTN